MASVKFVEVRRHSLTKKGWQPGQGSRLSQAGVELGRGTGAEMGRFVLVVASDVPRTAETATAMGFAVDETDERLAAHDTSLHEELDRFVAGKRLSFSQWAEIVAVGQAMKAHGIVQRNLWLGYASRVPDGAACLVISHGGTIEPGVILAVDRRIWQNWESLGQCDGVRLAADAGVFVSAELLRAPTEN